MKTFEFAGTKRFGRLSVIGPAFYLRNDRSRRVHVVAMCDCGNACCADAAYLRSGRIKSCGCLRKEVLTCGRKKANGAARRHGQSKTRLHRKWESMLQRCRNPNNPSYSSYGGRGIVVCEEWNEFILFYSWAMSSGYDDQLQIDRINNDGNYEPANCRWVTKIQNTRNTRRSLKITAFGETKCAGEWAEDPRCAVTQNALCGRIRAGWPHDLAILTKPRPGSRSLPQRHPDTGHPFWPYEVTP